MNANELIEALQKLTEEQRKEKVFSFHCGDCGGNEIDQVKVVEWGTLLI